MWTPIKPISATFDRPTGRGYAVAMKLAAVLILTATASTCSQPSEQEGAAARTRAVEAVKEIICKDGAKADAIATVAQEAQEAPNADIAQTVYNTASGIEKSGCAEIVKEKQADWQKQDAIMADVEAAAKK